MANFGPLLGEQPHLPDVNHCALLFRPKGHREPHNEVGSLSLAERLVGFELGTFRFLLQCLNPKCILLMGTNLQESSAGWFKLTNEILNIKGNIILCEVPVL